MFATSGGAFDAPRTTTTVQVGQMELRFSACTTGSVDYRLPAEGLSSEIAIQRLLPAGAALCQAAPAAGGCSGCKQSPPMPV